MNHDLEPSIPPHIVSEPGGLKDLMIDLFSNGYISNPEKRKYGSVASWKRVIGSEGNGIDNLFLVRSNKDGIEIEMEVTDRDLFGELAAFSVERTIQLEEKPQQMQEIYVLPLYGNYIIFSVPHLVPGIHYHDDIQIGFPLKPLSLDCLSQPLFKSIIKKSRRELIGGENIENGWFKFVQKHGTQLPSHIRRTLQKATDL